MKRIFISIICMCLFLSVLAGCGGGKTEYVFKAKQGVIYNDVMVVSDAWCSINGSTVLNITGRFDPDNSEYAECETYSMLFSFDTKGADSTVWDLKSGAVGVYFVPDEDQFKTQLSKMNIPYTGKISIKAEWFDDYTYISVSSQDGETHDYTCAIFNGDKKLSIPSEIDLKYFDDLCILQK